MSKNSMRQKYLNRLEQLIEQASQVPVETHTNVQENWATGKVTRHTSHHVDWPAFVEWRTSCVTILDHILPAASIHRKSIDSFRKMSNRTDHLEYGASLLKSLRDDIGRGLLKDIAAEYEFGISTDYMAQAANLLTGGKKIRYGYVPAAVLAGAVLEKNLKGLCLRLAPPEPVADDRGRPLRLNALIDAFKKRKVINELAAKELRTWAEIRNHAAHGEFDEFEEDQVSQMLTGIRRFIRKSMSTDPELRIDSTRSQRL